MSRRQNYGPVWLILATCWMASGAQGQTTSAPLLASRTYAPERYDEDWSHWNTTDITPEHPLATDPLKAIHFGDHGWMTFGGDWRIKAEFLDRPGFGLGAAKSDSWLMNRFLVHADVHANPHLRAFLQLGYHHVQGRDAPFPFDNDQIDVMQGFVETTAPLADGTLSLRFGRQELQAGSRKFWGTRQPINIRATFDGTRLAWRKPGWRADASVSHPVRILGGSFDDEPDRSVDVTAARLGHDFSDHGLKADLFYTRVDRRRHFIQGNGAADDRTTLGLRVEGTEGPWAVELETLVQRGSAASKRIRAFGGWSEIRYELSDQGMKPKLGLRTLWGSGDNDPLDDTVETFDPTYPFPPNDSLLMSSANATIVSPVVFLQPSSTSRLELRLDAAFRAKASDKIYTIPAFPISGTANLPGDNLLHLTPTLNASWQITPEWSVATQAAYMMPSGAFKAFGAKDTAYVAVWSSVRF